MGALECQSRNKNLIYSNIGRLSVKGGTEGRGKCFIEVRHAQSNQVKQRNGSASGLLDGSLTDWTDRLDRQTG